jgi:hypothetical protein
VVVICITVSAMISGSVYSVCLFYLFLWPLIDIYALGTEYGGRRDRLAVGAFAYYLAKINLFMEDFLERLRMLWNEE